MFQEFIVWLKTKWKKKFIKLCSEDALKLPGIWKHERFQKQERLKGEYNQKNLMTEFGPEGNLPFITAGCKCVKLITAFTKPNCT